MDLDLDPPRGMGPLRLGLHRSDAPAALAELGGDVDGPDAVVRASGMKISVEYGVGGVVNAVEVWRPHTPDDRALFRGIDVFVLPARTVLDRLEQLGLALDEDGDGGAVAAEVALALWRPFDGDDEPDDPQGFYFSSVLVARPGYYDTPAEAAARQARGEPSGN